MPAVAQKSGLASPAVDNSDLLMGWEQDKKTKFERLSQRGHENFKQAPSRFYIIKAGKMTVVVDSGKTLCDDAHEIRVDDNDRPLKDKPRAIVLDENMHLFAKAIPVGTTKNDMEISFGDYSKPVMEVFQDMDFKPEEGLRLGLLSVRAESMADPVSDGQRMNYSPTLTGKINTGGVVSIDAKRFGSQNLNMLAPYRELEVEMARLFDSHAQNHQQIRQTLSRFEDFSKKV